MRIVLATVETVDLAEWIIDGTHVLSRLTAKMNIKYENFSNYGGLTTYSIGIWDNLRFDDVGIMDYEDNTDQPLDIGIGVTGQNNEDFSKEVKKALLLIYGYLLLPVAILGILGNVIAESL